MKKQIIRVSILQTSKVMAVMYLFLTLPFLLLAAIPLWMKGGGGIAPWLFVLAMPLLYALFGFLFTAVAGWVYNLVAARMGGLEFTSAEAQPD
jgi:hypothetical protein